MKSQVADEGESDVGDEAYDEMAGPAPSSTTARKNIGCGKKYGTIIVIFLRISWLFPKNSLSLHHR